MKRLDWRIWLFIGLALLVYFPAIHGGFVWDDNAYVVNNTALRNLQGLWEIWFGPGRQVQYYPLTFTSLWLNHQFGGLNPVGYHLVNVIFHILNGLLVWRLLEHLKVKGAWFAALLFLLHPVQVESVAWITERKNVLSGFFYLYALLTYLRFKEEKTGLWPWYFISYFLFLAALLSKTVTATLPAAVLVILWWKEGRFSWADLVRLIPFLGTSMALGAVTVAFENRHMISTGIDEWNFSPIERFLIAGRALWFYLAKLIWPHPLIFIYPRWEIDSSALWQWAFPLSFILLLAVLWIFRSRWGRGPFATLAIFSVTLLPALGFKNFFPMRFSFVADHFQYLATIGPLACAVAITRTALEKYIRIRIALGIVLLLACGILSWKQSMIYENLEVLWRDTLSKNPNSWLAHNNLGMVLMQSGRDKEAGFHFKESIRLKPDFAKAYNNLGNVMTRQRNLRKAISYYQRAIRFQPNDEAFHSNLGTAFFGLGRIDKAVFHFIKAIKLDPSFASAHNNLGNALLKKGDTENAVRQYREAVELDPHYAAAHAGLGLALFTLGQTDQAITHYTKTIELDPDHAMTHNNLANALAQKGNLTQADEHYRKALRLEPDSALFRNNYGSFLANQGKIDEAINQYNEAIRIDPKNPIAQKNLRRISFQPLSKQT